MTDQPQKPSIRSFVKRKGRVTLGQRNALKELYNRYGIDTSQGEIDFKELFARAAPVALEIGCGNGDAMIEMASRYPEINFIGAEVYEPGVGRLLANVEKNGLTNVRVVMDDAVEVLKNNILDHSLDKIMIYFPDPWHKRNHHKRRLIKPEFIELITQKLKPSGELHLATDWEHYAEQMLKVCSAAPGLKNADPEGGAVPRPQLRPLTKFELRGQRLGHGVWDFIFTM